MKTCSKCHEIKPLSEFSNHKGNADGKFSYCKPCRVEYRKQPKQRAKQAICRMKHDGLPLDLKPTEIAWTLADKTCDYCGTELEYSKTTIDHIVPTSRGGRNTFENIACACSKCNTAKRDRPAVLYMLQSCEPYANRKLLERLALRSGRTVPEIYELLVEDVKEYFASRAEVTSSG
jgi:HNH endonuclease